MKQIHHLLIGLLSCFILFACEKETILTVDLTSLSFTDSGGTQSISLTANKPWTASSNQSWCKVSPSAGEEAASSRISITCDANTTFDDRSCNVTFTCAELTKTVSVSQATNNGLLVSQTSYELTKAAQQLNIQVQANVKFSVEVDNGCKDWVKYNTTKGLITNTVVLDIVENKSYDSREGKVTIKQDGGSLSSTITIKQSQLDGLFITTPEYNLSNENHTLTVEVSTNVEFDVKPEADWVKYVQTKGLSTKQIVLEVAENDTYDLRETRVNVKQKNGDLRGTITIRQDEKYCILVSQPDFNLSNEAAMIDVEVKYNVDFEVVIPEDCKGWIKQVSTKGLDSKTYTFSIAKNAAYDNREGSITFKQKNGGFSTTVAIKQKQTDYLEVEKTEYTVDIEGETISINVTSNVEYTISIEEAAQSWLSRVETKGLSKDKIQIAVAAGDDDTDRKGKIVIAYGEMIHMVQIHQYSYAANTIIQFADEKVKAKLVEAFDTNKDGELSIKEAREVKSIEGVFGAIKTYKSFDEFQYFTEVTEIPDNMFSDWNRLTSIKLPESIKYIFRNAFSGCVKLRSVIIPENVTNIYDGAFNNCRNLSEVVLPKNLYSIPVTMFSGCTSLTSITIPDSVTSIGESAFMGCTEITSIVIPESVNSIGPEAFKGCSQLESVTVLNTKNYNFSIGDEAFYDISENIELTSRYFKWSNLKKFINALRIDYTVLDGEEQIVAWDYSDYYHDNGLVSIFIPESVTTIGGGAFSYCRSLETVVISGPVTTIDSYTFQGCCNLTSVVIPESVTRIGYLAFSECTALTSFVIPESVSIIEEGAFSGCTALASVVIPESVSTIESNTFKGCNSLSSVIIPESVSIISDSAFSNCSGLKSIVIPESVTSIQANAFYSCTGLVSVLIPESVESVGDSAFENCTGLTGITVLSSSPPSLGSTVFFNTNNCSIWVPSSSVDNYRTSPGWSDYADRIQAILE